MQQHVSVIDDTIWSNFIARFFDYEKNLAITASAYIVGRDSVIFPLIIGCLGFLHMDVNDWCFGIYSVQSDYNKNKISKHQTISVTRFLKISGILLWYIPFDGFNFHNSRITNRDTNISRQRQQSMVLWLL